MKLRRWSWVVLLPAALALGSLAGCFESATVQCESGVICPNGASCTADGKSCTSNGCGNGVMEEGEACDDGNLSDHDDCLSDCTVNLCGDGKVDAVEPRVEDCDAFGVDTASCNADCSAVVCGDGHMNAAAGEACDDGNTVSADGCKADCTSDETCGNGKKDSHLPNHPLNTFDPNPCLVNTDPAPGANCAEVCDDGNNDNGDGCSSNCLSEEMCGNGIADVDEVCDDGDPDNGNECRNDCQGGAGCGNSLLDPSTEECDEPQQNGMDVATCDFDCTIPFCGDGHANLVADVDGVPGPDEVCDPGAPGAHTADCDSNCTRPTCGDGEVNRVYTPPGAPGPEQCDDGNTTAGDGCSAQCRIESCGNGVTEMINGEQCDDGNEIDLDACRSNCQLPRCGDGIASTPPIEACDTGGNSQSCDLDCSAAACGDGFINPMFTPPTASMPEACDDGNTVSGDGCSSLCRIESCGNGIMETVNGEQCDDGNDVDLDGCRNNCQTPRCGDGIASTPPIEICDTTVSTVMCDHDCTLPLCNDGIVNAAAGEQCEDGNVTNGDGCNSMCRLEPFTMTVVPGGSGTGTVTSSPAGITCGADCSELYLPGTMVTLTAVPAANSTFAGWPVASGCTGTAPCTITMSTVKTIAAVFDLNRLTVAKTGTGTGVVTASGISCGADCDEVYNTGTMVTLMAAPTAATSDFAGWSDPGCPGLGNCTVTLTAARTVTATFTLKIFTLTVARNGTGTGTVSSAPAGIACGGDCTEGFTSGTSVTLVAEPAADSDFTSWSVGACGTGTSCTVTMDLARTVTATFTLKSFVLTATKIGTGTGTVTSTTPAGGISCGADCTQSYDIGTMVTLSAAPAGGSRFVEWSGACAGQLTTTCTVTMDVAKTATAEFRTVVVLTTTASGGGAGTITSSPAGVNCAAASCTTSFDTGAVVTLTPTPAAGSRFVTWTGACTGATCTVTMSVARSVNAEFRPVFPMTVTKTGSGTGTVTSTTPAGTINCGTDCSEIYDTGTAVTLTATAPSGSRFSGWSGDCTGTGTCVTTMTAARAVTANFIASYVLTVTKNGNGTGTVTSTTPAGGISCGADCTETYDSGTLVTLAAAPTNEDAFTGWVGGGCTGTAPCTVTMDSALSVTATFVDNTLTVVRIGSGGGKVVSSVHAGTTTINCGGSGAQNCDEDYVAGTTVTLTATPSNASSRFVAWSANCAVGGMPNVCTIAMNGAATVTAEFTDVFTLDVAKGGLGAGTVTSTSTPTQAAQVACGATCSVSFDADTVVTLSAAATAGSTFTGWSGTGITCPGTGTCAVTMSQARMVTATFTSP